MTNRVGWALGLTGTLSSCFTSCTERSAGPTTPTRGTDAGQHSSAEQNSSGPVSASREDPDDEATNGDRSTASTEVGPNTIATGTESERITSSTDQLSATDVSARPGTEPGVSSAPTTSDGVVTGGDGCAGTSASIYDVADICYDWEAEQSGIPNTQRTSIRSIRLPEPTVAGTPYAVALSLNSASQGDQIELWGSTESCGDAGQLLWYGPLAEGELCAEFVPAEQYSSLLMVWRNLRGGLGASWDTVTFCAAGSCGENGYGLGVSADSPELDAPIGPFEGSGRIARGPLDPSIPVYQGFVRLRGPDEAVIGQEVPVSAGYFRLSTEYAQPFNDAWYCTGAGSTFTYLEEKSADVDDFASFAFENVTELARCPAQSGPYHLNYTVGAVRQITNVDTDLPEFGTEVADANIGDCDRANRRSLCFQEFDYETQPETKVFGFTVPGAADDTGVVTFTDVAIVQMTDTGPRAACATSGTVTFMDDNSMVFEFSGVTDWQTCGQGQPATPSSFHGELEF